MPRALVALALLAALLGAPRPVSAAVNTLSDAHASPTTGTVTTLFSLRVRYDGGFAATGVTVTVAGAQRPMALEQGALDSGTWVLATPLPAGTWPLTFAATVLRGPSPTLAGPTVSVAGAPDTTPKAPEASTSTDEFGDDPGSADEPNVAPAGPSQSAPSPDEPEANAETLTDEAAGSSVEGGAAASGSTIGEGKGSGTSPTDRPRSGAARSGNASPSPDPQGEDAAPVDGPDDPAVGSRTDSPLEPDGPLGMVLIVGLSGVAAVALVGTLLLAAGRRRHDHVERAVLAASATPEATPSDELLARRTIQRARMRITDDPILSALGVEEQMQARRNRSRRRAGAKDRPDRDA